MAPKILELATWFVKQVFLNQKSWLPNGGQLKNFNLNGQLKKIIMIENEEEDNIFFIIILFHQRTPSDNIKT